MRRTIVACVLLFIVSLSLPSCGHDDDAARVPSDTAGSAAPREKKPVDPATVGRIVGLARFEGAPPKRVIMDIAGAGGCPAHDGAPQLTEDVIVNDGHLANVFVQLRGVEGWIPPSAAPRTLALDQAGCMYRPRVLGMRVGEVLHVHNSDPTNHNVNIRASRNEGGNPVQSAGGPDIEWKPTMREVLVPFECTLHPWMKAWVGVLDHPWFAVSAADGAFAIEGVPPGEYEIESWHEKLGKRTVKVTVLAHGTASVEIVYGAH